MFDFSLYRTYQGVTFLALGYAAPDIFTGVAGFVNSSNTGNLALGSLIGEFSR